MYRLGTDQKILKAGPELLLCWVKRTETVFQSQAGGDVMASKEDYQIVSVCLSVCMRGSACVRVISEIIVAVY